MNFDLSEKNTCTLHTLRRIDPDVVEIIGETSHVSIFIIFIIIIIILYLILILKGLHL
jgi:hypothetical protein